MVVSDGDKALASIAGAEFPLIVAPWKGVLIPIKVRKMSATQIMACGNFSLIETDSYQREKEKPTEWSRYCQYAEQTHKLCRASMVSPTYERVFEIVGRKDFNAEMKAQFLEIKQKIGTMQRGPARKELEQKNEATRVLWEFLLPDDFMSAIVTWQLESDNEGIKSLTTDILLELAILAEKGHDNPSDHVDGTLTAFHRLDIDRQAFVAHAEWKRKNATKKG